MAGRIAYYGNIVRDGLILDLDAAKRDSYPGNGTIWRDIAGGVITGSLINGPTFDPNNGGSIVFDGVDDYVNFSTTLPASTIYTVSCWFTATTGNWNGALFGFGTGASPNTQDVYLFGGGGGCGSPAGGSFGFNTWNCDSYGIGNASTLLKNNGFHHVVAIFRNQLVNTNNLWLDGIPQTLSQQFGTTTTTANLTNQFKIASNGWYVADQIWRGSISSCQVYNRALSSAEVTQNYNALKGRYGL